MLLAKYLLEICSHLDHFRDHDNELNVGTVGSIEFKNFLGFFWKFSVK